MKRIIWIAPLLIALACATTPNKEIYIPQELASNDFNNPESDWCYDRMLATPNVAIFWEKGFGADVAQAPELEGKPMTVDMANLADKLEYFYGYFADSLQFVKPGSKAEKYKMMVMLRYSLEGTAYGGDYDQQIGALWVTPGRLQDSTLNCIAHELGHSFQSQITCDGQGEAWGGSGFFEMASQWMLWQVNPNWVSDEAYHFDAFRTLTHKAFLHIDNIYHSPYVLEAWGEMHGKPFIAELFRKGKIGEDPVMTYKQITGADQEQFNDEMYGIAAKIINLDFPRTKQYTRRFAATFDTPMLNADGWLMPDTAYAPENYGFDVVKLDAPKPGESVKVQFEGLASVAPAGYNVKDADQAGWRYGFVAIDGDGEAIYGEMNKDANGEAVFVAPADKELQKLFMVVMGAPKQHSINPEPSVRHPQWPYRIKVTA